jgi:D-alanyl-D-alanine carboxypeptidase
MSQTYINDFDIDPEKFQEGLDLIEKYFQQRLGEDLGPGVALAFTDRLQLLGVITQGFADVTTKKPVAPETLFEIGSISKTFTALACFQQVQAGNLDLNAPVTNYLDWFEVGSEYSEPVRIHHLLSHTSGLVGMIDSVPNSRFQVWQLRNTSLGFAPGKHFSYSNMGYVVLGYVLEQVTGLSYAETIRKFILHPLQMTTSEPVITHDIYDRLARGYWSTHFDDRPASAASSPYPAPWFEFRNASGSVACTAGDLAIFLRMLLNEGKSVGGDVLSMENFHLMTTPNEGLYGEYAHGYGIFVKEHQDYDRHKFIWNGGEMVGYHAILMGDMDDGIGVVLFINGEANGIAESEFAIKVLNAVLHGKDLPALPAPQPPRRVVTEPDSYAGSFISATKNFQLQAEKEHLIMIYGSERIYLEQWYPGVFRVPHPDFDRALLKVTTEGDIPTEAAHGPDWFWVEAYEGSTDFDYPVKWDYYAGHYHTYSPWMNDFRVYVRKGQLYIQFWGTYESLLSPLDDGSFRYGEAEYSPDRLRFDCIVEGRATRANLSGAEYYRIESN